MSNQIKVTLKKSLIGRLPLHIQTANALGLKKINQTRLHPNNVCIRGMINRINYLLEIEELS